MILKQNEINKAAFADDKSIDRIDRFKSGAKWAESKFEEIAIEFGRFAYEHYEDSYLSFEELFQLFIKKRNEK